MDIEIHDETPALYGGYKADFRVTLPNGHVLEGTAFTGAYAESRHRAVAKSLTKCNTDRSITWIYGLESTGRPVHSRNRLRPVVLSLAKKIQRHFR